ncbi:integral membrane sensor protein [Streptomyces zhaozhouensis]|uniref:Integral membrane sensor protein n=1 Tax=Streptomyces zhaozhouensis TaxID=1300267 RepID=A0A286E1K3_9ACTN|nr:SpoIIE family protein phosphatase [Streptomyces zhaozhouensis]SOD64772.1 integral membrane sensor protein [Streptomyces zhaozhouensis]
MRAILRSVLDGLRRMRGRAFGSVLSGRSVVGQMFIIQLVIVLLLAASAVTALILQSRSDKTHAAIQRSLSAAEAFANGPGLVEALESEDPTRLLQPRAEAARKGSDVDFIVVLDYEGVRYTHPKTDRIGKKFVGSLDPVRAGETVTESLEGTLGPLHQATVPVEDENGETVGMVSAGVTVRTVNLLISDELPLAVGSALVAVALVTGGTALVSRRLLRQTRGLGPAEITRMYEHHDAVLHAVREGVLILDTEQRLTLVNEEAERLLQLGRDATGRRVDELGLDRRTVRLLASDREATDEVHLWGDRLITVNHRLIHDGGDRPGTVTTLRDTTEMRVLSGQAEAAQRRLALLYRASVAIGTTLDVRRTAEELTEVAVPDFADLVSVDLAQAVLRGEEAVGAEERVRRAAVGPPGSAAPLHPAGTPFRLEGDAPQVAELLSGRPVLTADLAAEEWWRCGDGAFARRTLDAGLHSLITAPLVSRGVVVGLAGFWRGPDRPEPFDMDDLSLAEELAARTAVCVENARRYTREHDMTEALQRSLLPTDVPPQSAVVAASRYLPAQAGVGGDFFDVIPLSGARVALVVGDIVGHGLHAAVTMGLLRGAVHNFAALDLTAEDLLGRLDELAERSEENGGLDPTGPITGATCLYAIYDPVDGRCVLGRAGHLPPVLAYPDGTVELPDLPAHPPLGVGVGMPFETVTLELPEGTRIGLYTDGLVESRDRDIDEGLARLGRVLADAPAAPAPACEAVLAAMLPAHPTDDVALLIARTRRLAPDRVAEWEVPEDSSAVPASRVRVAEAMAGWGLDSAAFGTALIVTELVTNALRHGVGPIRVRLLRDRSLICEVSDRSGTSPHVRNAAMTDEGGRGLFLVSHYAHRWGTRHGREGKVIWAEQRVPPAASG